jgi:enoyl-CoA hydratase
LDASADADVLIRERRAGVLVITINRPHVRNALDDRVSLAMAAALDDLDADDRLAVGIVTGAGGTFSSGMDLKAFGEGRIPVVEGRGLAGFAEAPPRKPLIAAVEGYALAGGFEVALACDMIVASTEASFGIPEVKRGLLASGGALVRLPHRIPRNVAMELALTGAPVSARRCAELGLVNRLAEPGRALASALELADEIAGNAPLAVAAAKEVLAFASTGDEASAWERQRPVNDRIAASADAREGALAFIEKRRPSWAGR